MSRLCLVLVFTLSMVLGGCGKAEKTDVDKEDVRVHTFQNLDCDGIPKDETDLMLEKVEIGEKLTTVTFAFTLNSQKQRDEPYRITAFPPGHTQAFYVFDVETAKKYALRNVRGIDIAPVWTTVSLGQPHRFTLEFEPLPASTKRIHIIEGETQNLEEGIPWRCMDVELK